MQRSLALAGSTTEDVEAAAPRRPGAQAHRRVTFRSVDDLVSIVARYMGTANDDPKPFVWTASAGKIEAKLKMNSIYEPKQQTCHVATFELISGSLQRSTVTPGSIDYDMKLVRHKLRQLVNRTKAPTTDRNIGLQRSVLPKAGRGAANWPDAVVSLPSPYRSASSKPRPSRSEVPLP